MSDQKRPPGFAIIDADFIKDFWPNLRPLHRSLITVLRKHGAKAFPKQSEMAKLLGVRRQTVNVALQQLVILELYAVYPQWRPNRGGRSTNVYTETDWANPDVRARIVRNLTTMKFDKHGGLIVEQHMSGPDTCSCGPQATTLWSTCHNVVAPTPQHMSGFPDSDMSGLPDSVIDTGEKSVASPLHLAAQGTPLGSARDVHPLHRDGLLEAERDERLDAEVDPWIPPLEADGWDNLDLEQDREQSKSTPVAPATPPARPGPTSQPASKRSNVPENINEWDGRDFARRFWRMLGEHRKAQGHAGEHTTKIPNWLFVVLGQRRVAYGWEGLYRTMTAVIEELPPEEELIVSYRNIEQAMDKKSHSVLAEMQAERHRRAA